MKAREAISSFICCDGSLSQTLFLFSVLSINPNVLADREKRRNISMASAVDAIRDPIPTSAVLMVSSKHIAEKCRAENISFIKCKKQDQNPEKCLEKGQHVTGCVLSLLKGLQERCSKEMDAYAGCMYYHTNEFELCRKEQKEFEKACPWSE